MNSLPQTFIPTLRDRDVPRASVILGWLGDLLGSSILTRLLGAREYQPLVERVELEDRDVYTVVNAVEVRHSWAGEYWIALDLPGIDASSLVSTIADGRVILRARDCRTAQSPCARGRSYVFALPKDCDPTTLDFRAHDGWLTIMGRRVGRTTRSLVPFSPLYATNGAFLALLFVASFFLWSCGARQPNAEPAPMSSQHHMMGGMSSAGASADAGACSMMNGPGRSMMGGMCSPMMDGGGCPMGRGNGCPAADGGRCPCGMMH